MHTIYHFHVDVIENVPSFETVPLLDDKNRLVGSIIRLVDDKVRGFISGHDSPIGLKISLNEPFYMTPVQDKQGVVSHALVTEFSTGVTSIKVPYVVEDQIGEE